MIRRHQHGVFFLPYIIMYYIIYNNSELYHYGVKGMKWGVRHDKESKNRKRHRTSKESVKKNKKLSKGAKIAIGIAASAAILGATVYLAKTGKFSRLAKLGAKALVNDISVNAPISNQVSQVLQVADAVKPIDKACNYNSFAAALYDSGLNVSVKSGSFAKYEGNITNLMQRGLKNPDSRIFDTIPKSTFTDSEKLSNTILRIAKNTEAACGQIGSDLSRGSGGHAFNWKIINGKVKYYDIHANVNGVYQPLDDVSDYISRGLINGNNGKITRLDGLTKDDFIMDYISDILDFH